MKAKCLRAAYSETDEEERVMNIVVCVKQVPNTKAIRIDPKTNNIMREGVPSIMNPYDANAIEEALKILDYAGGAVTALSMGPQQAVEILQEALDMGADKAILLSDRAFAGSDTLATGYILSTVIKELSPDLVICGAEAIDGATGQVGPVIAQNLGWPQFTNVNEIRVEGNIVHISRDVRKGYELYTCDLPAVACVLKGINNPRGAVSSNKKPEIYNVDNFEFDLEKIGLKGSPTQVVNISTSGRMESSFVTVDSFLPAEERLRMLMNGGIISKKINFMRGTGGELADFIMQDDTVKRHLNGLKEAKLHD